MQKFLDLFSWWFLLLFAIPTVLIMGSWNSLPGEPTYGVKISLERMLLFFAKPSYAAEASLNVKYTERRLSETKILLADKQSGKGLTYLSQQVEATKAVINRAPNQATRQALARQYVATLRTAATELNQQRQEIVSSAGAGNPLSPTRRVYPTATSFPAYHPTNAPNVPTATPPQEQVFPSPTPTLSENPVDVVDQIDNTTDTINKTIDDLTKLENLPEDKQQQMENILEKMKNNNEDKGKGDNNNNQDKNKMGN